MKEIKALLERERIRERISTLYQLLGGHKTNYEVEIRELIESSKIEEKSIEKKLSIYFI